MTQATATLPQPIRGKVPKRGTVWTPEDVPVIQRLREEATLDGVDWRTDWKKIKPAKIRAVVDELFPSETECGAAKAYRIQKLIPVIPEDIPAQNQNPEPPPTVQIPAVPKPEPTAHVQDSGPESTPELRFGRLRRAAAGTGVFAVAVVAAMISYAHQKQLAADHGQTGILADVWPLGVDGLILGCGIMVATDRLRGYHPRPWALIGFWLGVVVSIASNALAGNAGILARAISAFPAIALLIAVEALTTGPTRRRRVVSPPRGTYP